MAKKKAAKRKLAKRKAAKTAKPIKGERCRAPGAKSISRANKRKRGPGKPKFEPTVADRQNVETLAGLGIRTDDIKYLVINPQTGKHIAQDTLLRHFSDELASGRPKAHAIIAQTLFNKAKGDGHQSVAAAIWFSKTQMGWREKVAVEVEAKSGVLVAPMSVSPEQWIAATAARAIGKLEPGAEEGS